MRVREGGLSYGRLALISWLATASFGAFLLYWWIGRLARATARARLTHSRPPPYIPRLLVFLHVLVAVAGLVAWMGALFFVKYAEGVVLFDHLGFVALGSLVLVAMLGVSMFLRWLGSRRARRAATSAHRAPPVSRLPTVVVIGHGLLGVATVLLVVLSYFRP